MLGEHLGEREISMMMMREHWVKGIPSSWGTLSLSPVFSIKLLFLFFCASFTHNQANDDNFGCFYHSDASFMHDQA
jgi:hypothetical protein